jgi:tRNA(Ser,Leu) C12 N-acetylase TAN1
MMQNRDTGSVFAHSEHRAVVVVSPATCRPLELAVRTFQERIRQAARTFGKTKGPESLKIRLRLRGKHQAATQPRRDQPNTRLHYTFFKSFATHT